MLSATKLDISSARLIIDNWLASDTLRYNPFSWKNSEEALFRRKCFAELSLYFQISDVTGSSFANDCSLSFQELRSALRRHLNGGLVGLAARNPNNILMFAGPLSIALKEDLFSPTDRRVALSLLSSPASWGAERLPFRHLDLAASAHYASVEPQLSLDALLSVSALAVPPLPTSATNDAFYAVTHCVFYAYGVMGRAPDDWLNHSALYASIEGCACRCIVTDHIDLGLELVAASALLGLPIGPAQRLLVAEVVQRIANEGVTQCLPSAAAESFMKLRPDEQWAHEFHTMLVAAVTFLILERTEADFGTPVEESDTLFVHMMGQAFVAALDYDLGRAAELGSVILQSFDTGPHELLMIGYLFDFLKMSENVDGSFGRLVDEHRLAELACFSGFRDPSDLREVPWSQRCSTFLTAYRRLVPA